MLGGATETGGGGGGGRQTAEPKPSVDMAEVFGWVGLFDLLSLWPIGIAAAGSAAAAAARHLPLPSSHPLLQASLAPALPSGQDITDNTKTTALSLLWLRCGLNCC